MSRSSASSLGVVCGVIVSQDSRLTCDCHTCFAREAQKVPKDIPGPENFFAARSAGKDEGLSTKDEGFQLKTKGFQLEVS
jgi:hypothetical protein